MLEEKNAEISEMYKKIYRRGFTLVELLLVILLMAIIIGISSPAWIGMGRGAGMRGSVRAVSSTLSLLRQWAITHKENVTFYYFEGVAPSASYYYAVNEANTVLEKTNELPMEVMFGGSTSVTFKTDGGLASGAVPEHIYILDRKFTNESDVIFKGKTISINGLTGGIHVE